MNLNEFSTKELEHLRELLDDEISFIRKMLPKYSMTRTGQKDKDKLDFSEMLKVKINNHLGKFD